MACRRWLTRSLNCIEKILAHASSSWVMDRCVPRWSNSLEAGAISGATRLTGAVAPPSIPALLSSMDAAVAPYAARPGFYFSPLKILEYMAAGLPIVASRLGQIQELISDGETGLLCEPDDVPSLVERLRWLRDVPGLRQKLGSAARAAVLKDHTWLDVTQRIFARAGFSLREVRC